MNPGPATIRVVRHITEYGDRHRAVVLHPDLLEQIVEEQTGVLLKPAAGMRNQIMGKTIITSTDIPTDVVLMADPEPPA